MGNTSIDISVNPDINKGGYSGRPIFPKALTEVKTINTKLALIGCGGIFNGSDVSTMLNEGGCKLVQLHSAIPYRGPFIVKKILKELGEISK
jgi:dihydroorotate dehydrogenase